VHSRTRLPERLLTRHLDGHSPEAQRWAHCLVMLMLAEQSCRSGHRLEFGHAQGTQCERISQKFSHEVFGATMEPDKADRRCGFLAALSAEKCGSW
jgi:hypothetical protein